VLQGKNITIQKLLNHLQNKNKTKTKQIKMAALFDTFIQLIEKSPRLLSEFNKGVSLEKEFATKGSKLNKLLMNSGTQKILNRESEVTSVFSPTSDLILQRVPNVSYNRFVEIPRSKTGNNLYDTLYASAKQYADENGYSIRVANIRTAPKDHALINDTNYKVNGYHDAPTGNILVRGNHPTLPRILSHELGHGTTSLGWSPFFTFGKAQDPHIPDLRYLRYPKGLLELAAENNAAGILDIAVKINRHKTLQELLERGLDFIQNKRKTYVANMVGGDIVPQSESSLQALYEKGKMPLNKISRLLGHLEQMASSRTLPGGQKIHPKFNLFYDFYINALIDVARQIADRAKNTHDLNRFLF
jgi:hypothetical protein